MPTLVLRVSPSYQKIDCFVGGAGRETRALVLYIVYYFLQVLSTFIGLYTLSNSSSQEEIKMPEQAVDDIPPGCGLVVKVNLLNVCVQDFFL